LFFTQQLIDKDQRQIAEHCYRQQRLMRRLGIDLQVNLSAADTGLIPKNSNLSEQRKMDQVVILVVDDEPLNIDIITEYLNDGSDTYLIETACNGKIAWQLLDAEPNRYDIVLLDKMMPEMNGLQVLALIVDHPILKYVPVILQTAKNSTSDIVEGMQAGAYYYLTKPFSEEMLLSVVNTAVKDGTFFKQLQGSIKEKEDTMGLLVSSCFQFQTITEAQAIARLLAHACPDPSIAVIGLSELMINAVEHGNLGITYQEKSYLRREGIWEEEIERRLLFDENKNKMAKIHYSCQGNRKEFIIVDQGIGFDWHQYMEFSPERLMDSHGRGIAMSKAMVFTGLEYRGNGNEVCAYIDC